MSGGHSMESTASVQDARQSIREEVRRLCQDFPDRYWQDVDKHEKYPQEFVDALTESGYLAALIPEEYGGAGLGITEASIILEEINRSGGNSAVCHAQMYTMGTLLRHGSEEQKGRYLPSIAQGKLRLQAFAVPSPMPDPRPRGSRHALSARETGTSSTVRKFSFRARTTPI